MNDFEKIPLLFAVRDNKYCFVQDLQSTPMTGQILLDYANLKFDDIEPFLQLLNNKDGLIGMKDKFLKYFTDKFNVGFAILLYNDFITGLAVMMWSERTQTGQLNYKSFLSYLDKIKIFSISILNHIISNKIDVIINSDQFSEAQELTCKIIFIPEENSFITLFKTFDTITFIMHEISQIVTNCIPVKICANCNDFFIPSSRNYEVYCDKIYRGNRTCKQLGYENKDEFIKAYRTAYKTRNAVKNRNLINNPHAEDDFKKWVHTAKIKLEEARNGEFILNEFKDWLKQ